MRRSICQCEPSTAFAGDVRTWRFSYTTSISLPKGTRLKFDLLSQGRSSDWQIPEANPKDKENMIWAVLPNGKPIPIKEVTAADNFSTAFEFTLPQEIKAGETITIFIGTPEKSREMQVTKGNRAQTYVQRRRPFHLYIDPKGKGDYKEAEVFSLDVRGNVLENIQVTVPSIVSKNKRFDVFLRFEDRFGNLTGNAPEGTLIELSYEQLRENLTWKLFVPETGFITLPNLYFNEAGIYKIQLFNTKTGEKFYSSPIKCFSDYDKNLYWGLLHGESEKIDAQENIEPCLRHFRDEKGLQFFATSPFEEETSNEVWKQITHYIAELNEEARFTTFLGFQWFNEAPDEGLRHLLYWKDGRPLLRKKDAKTNTLKKIYKSHTPKELMSIPCFSMAKGFATTFSDFTPEFERVVEIYNAWGSSECSEKEGNLRPIKSLDKTGIQEFDAGSIRTALNRNYRFGFVAGGLDDRGVYDGLFDSEQIQYSPGLTAILAIEQTRETLLQALYNRACYATTGARIVLGFNIAGAQLGSELTTKLKPGLAFNRHITGFVAGTAPLKEVTLIRNGKPFHSFHPNKSDFEFAFDDSDPLSKLVLSSSDERPPFVYYYLRVVQEDGHIAWASPIWVDYPEFQATEAPKKVKKR